MRGSALRVLVLHNSYRLYGGEDAAVSGEVELLREHGDHVVLEGFSNKDVAGLAGMVDTFLESSGSAKRAAWARELVRAHRPDVVHIHNFFPLLTPSIHMAAFLEGSAVVQTLHNYRLLCAGALLLRDGLICEKCVSGSRFWGVLHRCYRGSLAGSLAVVRMQERSFRRGVWHKYVNRFIALTEFAKAKFVEGGLPADTIEVKPNFARPPTGEAIGDRRGALYVGRLSPEKGIADLVAAWHSVPERELTVIGDGPLAEGLRQSAPRNVRFLGHLTKAEVAQHMLNAGVLVVPSRCFEGFPVAVAEAFAAGLPVAASNLGSLAEIVAPEITGVLFPPNSPTAISDTVRALLLDEGRLASMSMNAKRAFNEHYSPLSSYRSLTRIYESAVSSRRSMSGRSPKQ